jgi:uncharacterized protein (TIGR02246 family)
MKLLLSILLFLALAIMACQPAEESADSSPATATSTQADEAAIKQLYKQMEEKWNAADLDGWMAIYADDIVQMAPGRPATVGKEVLSSGYKKFLSEYTDTWKVLIEHIEISGDLAIVRDSGTDSWTPKDGGETTTYIGKGLRVFRRGVDGSWKMIIEIWNPNEPNAKEFPG